MSDFEQAVHAVVVGMKRRGLNPFDIFTWEDLYTLFVGMTHVLNTGISEDASGTRALLQAMWQAMERKAEDEEMKYGSDEIRSVLSELEAGSVPS